MMAVVRLKISVVRIAERKAPLPSTAVQCSSENTGVVMNQPTRVMKLPPMRTRTGITVSISRRATIRPKMTGPHVPRSTSPGLKLPVIVVYRRRDTSHRCTGTITAIRTSMMLASAVACPYSGGSKTRMKWKILVE